MSRVRKTAALALAWLASSASVLAQEDIPPPAEPAALEEIVVTAQKRVESLQDTPISIAAFSTQKLELRGIEGLADLKLNVPSLTVEPFPTHNATLRIFIRGVGINDAQLTQDPAVGVYMDGVYIARSVGLALDLAELERIEVLRGPQGTLYGRNTTGGAVNLVTRRPDPSAFSARARVSGASRQSRSGKVSLNIPLGDTLAVKLAGLLSARDGFVENTGPGGEFGDREESAGRLDLRWQPDSAAFTGFTADYSFESADMRYVNQYFQSTRRPTTNKGQAEVFKPYAEANTLHSTERLRAISSSPPMEESGTRIDGHALTLALPFSKFELKYIGAWRRLVDAEYADLGGGLGSTLYRLDSHAYDGPAADAANGGPTPLVIPEVRHRQTSHELQFSGHLLDESLRVLAGGFWFAEDGVEDRHRYNHQLSTAISPDQVDELSAQFPEFDSQLALLGMDLSSVEQFRLVNFVDLWWSIENRARAGFFDLSWTPSWFGERLTLGTGYRHSEDSRAAVKYRRSDNYIEAYSNGQGRSPPRPLSSAELFNYVPAARRFSDDSLSWVVSFALTPSIRLYGKSAEAYKSGGFNVRDPNVSAASAGNTYGFGFIEGFAPERVQAYELGFKSEWLGRRLRLNADVFRAEYTDMQINFLIPGTVSDTKTRNAGQAQIDGFEIDLGVALGADLTLSAEYAYLDADVIEAIDRDGRNVASLFPFTSAPPHSGVLAVDWSFLSTPVGELRAYASWSYSGERSGQVITEERRGLSSIPAYGLYNARLMLSGTRVAGGTLDFALWGRNLADHVYPQIAIDNVPQSDRAVVWGEPRSLGMDVVYRWE